MQFSVQRGADGRTLRLIGELDLSTIDDFVGPLEERLGEGWGDLVLDASALTFIDSTGVKALIDVAQRLGEGRELVLMWPRPSVSRTLDLMWASSFPNLVIRPAGTLSVA